MHFSSATLSVLLAAILIGCGAGAEYCLYPYLITRMFGLRRFGQLYSGVYIAAALSYSVGPVVMGRTYDALGSYRFGFIGFEVALVLTLVLVGSLRRYVYALDGSKL